MKRISPIILPLFFILFCIFAPSANAVTTAPMLAKERFYAGPTVKYRVTATRYRTQAINVLAVLNTKNIGLRFVPAKTGEKVDLTIRYSRLGSTICKPGKRAMGYGGKGFVEIDRSCTLKASELVLIHELGHALGLDHNDSRCTIMNSVMRFSSNLRQVNPTRCSLSKFYGWTRAPYNLTELSALRTLYRNRVPIIVVRPSELNPSPTPYVLGPNVQFYTLEDRSYDPDWNITSYEYRIEGLAESATTVQRGSFPTGQYYSNTSAIYNLRTPTIGGAYTLYIKITDSYGASVEQRIPFTVLLPVPIPPVNIPVDVPVVNVPNLPGHKK